MRLAVLADIHGNLPALEAVADELERLQPDAVVVDGDLINAVPYSGPVLDFIRATDWLVVRGNHEFYYLNFGSDRDVPDSGDPDRWGQLHWLVEHLTSEQGRYLAGLPDELTTFFPGTQPIRVAHGVPGNHRCGFYEGQPEEEILPAIQHVGEATQITAHTHVQFDRQLRSMPGRGDEYYTNPHGYVPYRQIDAHLRRWHLINPGSVGMPLNGDVRAQFAMLESAPEDEVFGGWKVTFHRVPYDRRPVLEYYERSGMLAAGGVISQLFYWEIVTADLEIPYFFQWARERFSDPDARLREAFDAYIEATGRDRYVRSRDPLYNGHNEHP